MQKKQLLLDLGLRKLYFIRKFNLLFFFVDSDPVLAQSQIVTVKTDPNYTRFTTWHFGTVPEAHRSGCPRA